MAKSRARKLADIIVGAGIDIDGNLTFDGGSTSADLTFADNDKANFGDASDLQIFHNGSHSFIKDAGTGDLYIGASNNLALMNSAFSENYLLATTDGAVTLYYDGASKLATTSTGATITGTLVADGLTMGDNEKIQLGTGNDLRIYHDGSHSRILENGTGNLIIQGTNLDLADTATGENFLRAVSNSSVDLYYDGTKKFETSSAGVDISGALKLISNISFSSSEAGRIYKASNHGLAFHGVTGTENDFALFTPAGQLMVVNPTGTNNVSLVPSAGGSVGVGTGTSSPARKLEVKAGSEGYVARFKGSTSAVDIFAGNTGSFTGGLITTPTSIPLGLSTNTGTGALIIATNNNVGIGTASPNYLLDVEGTGSLFRVNSTSGAAVLQISVPDTTSINDINFGDSGSTTSGQIRYRHNGDSLAISTAGAERLRIDSSGNVGIGTTESSAKLHVRASAVSGVTNVLDVGNAVNAAGTGHGARLRLYSTPDENRGVAISSFSETNYAVDNSMLFYTSASSTLSEKMRITSAGNVGIGTTNPSGTLHVKSTGNGEINIERASGALINLQAQASAAYIGTNSNHQFGLKANGSVRLKIATSGAITFNDAFTFPTSDGSAGQVLKTDGSGNLTFQNDSSGGGGGGSSTSILDSDGDTKIQVEESSDEDIIRFDTAGSERLIINSSGRIGIGHGAPNAQLHINAGNNNSVSIGTATNPALQIGGTTNYRFGVYTDNETAFIENKNGDDGIVFRVKTAGEAMRIDGGTGNVGIGTSSPDKMFVVQGPGAEVVISDTDTTDTPRLRFRESGSTSGAIHTDASHMIFSTPTTERMRISSSGDWMVSNTVANVASAYSNQAGCGWVDSDLHFEAATTSNRSAAEFGRNNGNSGDVITIRQQATSVGMIGTEGGDSLVIQSNGSTGSGLRFHPSVASIQPVRAGATIDNTISLGADTRRFKDLHLSNAVNVGHASIETSSTSTTATTQVAIATFAAATFRSAEFTIQITNSTDSTYHLTKVLLIHDGTTPGITEYGTVFTGSAAEATFDADISSGNVRLLATPASTDSMTFKVVRHCITV